MAAFSDDFFGLFGRRTLLGAASIAGLALLGHASARKVVPLWPAKPPGGGGPDGPEQISGGAVSNISQPRLEVFTPARPNAARPNGAAVLVAGGGGYREIQMRHEAHPAARFLAAQGITAFVLTYRLPGEGWAAGRLAPFQDAQRALRIIRAQMPGGKIGVLGFSAGGHLMGIAAMRPDFRFYAPLDALDAQSSRPDAAALIYPVITLEPPYDQILVCKALFGAHPSAALSAAWSVQNYVHTGAPPVFLAQALDDPIVNPANCKIMAAACRNADVPAALHWLPSGGHGFGMGRPGSPTGLWPGWYQTWLQAQGFSD